MAPGRGILGVHGLALVIRGSARELDVLLSAAPRDGLLGQPELAATLAAARIYLGSNREVRELVAAAAAGVDSLPQPRAERLRVVLDLVETGHARTRGDLVALAAAARRVPDDPRTLSGLGLAGWDVIPLLVLGNAGTAELWTGDVGRGRETPARRGRDHPVERAAAPAPERGSTVGPAAGRAR